MISNATRSPLVPGPAPAPVSTPTPPDREPPSGAAAHPFAEMLRQNRLAESPRDAAPAQATAANAAKDRRADTGESPEATASGPPATQRDANQAKARIVGAARTTARSNPVPARSTSMTEPARNRPDEDGASATSTGADPTALADPTKLARPELAQGVDPVAGDRGPASVAHAPRADAELHGLGAADRRPASGEAAALGVATSATSPSGPAAGRRTGPDAGASAATVRSDAAGIGSEEQAAKAPTFREALAESKPATPASAPVGEDRVANLSAAPAQIAEPLRNAGPSVEVAPPSATLPVPVDSPEFAAAFGLQVSTFARDGIQHAELHLNPTDMGPVSIQITLDGSQARVDFGADAAATRHAIEAGLPELASALRDAGFTLAGGGVAQHSRSNGGNGDDADPKDSAARRAAAAPVARLDAAAQRVARRISAGGVDLYA